MNQGSLSVVSVGAAAVQLVGANPNRVALTLTVITSGIVTISDRPDVTSGAGLGIKGQTNPLYLDLHNCGDWIQKTLYAFGSAANQGVGVMEVICPCHQPPLAP